MCVCACVCVCVCVFKGPAGNVYYLDLDVLETRCYIRNPKPWKHCTVRPFMETVGNLFHSYKHTHKHTHALGVLVTKSRAAVER